MAPLPKVTCSNCWTTRPQKDMAETTEGEYVCADNDNGKGCNRRRKEAIAAAEERRRKGY